MFSLKQTALLFISSVFLNSCLFGNSSGGGGLSSQVGVRIISQFSDSPVRTSSGLPYITIPPARLLCRNRPFSVTRIRDQLRSSIDTDLLDTLFESSAGSGEAGGEAGGEGSDPSEAERLRSQQPVFTDVGERWIKFGLQLANNTNFTLIISSVRIKAATRHANQLREHEASIDPGYCSDGSDAPFLYIVPPKSRVEYQPFSTNPFHNLTLYFSDFWIDDCRNQNSPSLQRTINSVNTNTQQAGQDSDGSECTPNETYIIPTYSVDVILNGYFIGLTREYLTFDFFKRLSFSTANINY